MFLFTGFAATAQDQGQKDGRPAKAASGRPDQPYRICDTVRTLIEMADTNEGCASDLQSIYDVLRKLDTAGNGKIDTAALKAESSRILEERVNGVFARLDTNKDGKISREEAHGLIKDHFEKIDTNKNGQIEHDELLQAARQRHERAASPDSADSNKQK